jgi:hypothetical protein
VDDSTGARIYHFKGHRALPGHRWSMLDTTGAEVATLVRPPLHIHPTFTVSQPGHVESLGVGVPLDDHRPDRRRDG